MDSSPQLLNAENSSRAEMIAALASLPTVSISMAPDELFGLRGIHRGQNLETEDLEYACSMELMYPDTPRWRGHGGIQTPAGIRIQGGGARWHEGRNDAKQSFGLRFRGMYGASKLNYPVFESAPLNAASATDKFDKLILRAGHNKGWACDWDPANTVYTRDQFTRDLQIAMSGYGVHGTFVLLYLNGLFWGLYNLVERADHAYQASYFGGNEDDYYSGKKKGGTIRGSRAAYTSLHRSSARLSFDQVSAQLDVVSYIDQALLASYAAIGDYPQYYYGNRLTPVGPIRYFVWDAEDSWGGGSTRTGPCDVSYKCKDARTNNPQLDRLGWTESFWKLWGGTAGFRQLWIDRAYYHLAIPGGALTSASLLAKWATLCDAIQPAMLLESARWGDELRKPGYTRRGSWLPARRRMETALIGRDERMQSVLQQKTANNVRMYAVYPPPRARLDGSEDELGQGTLVVPRRSAVLLLQPVGTGRDLVVRYTLDGTDPRTPGGSPAAASVACAQCRLDIAGTAKITARSHSGSNWSPPLRLTLIVAAGLQINEVADKGDPDDRCAGADWVELRNPTPGQLPLEGLVLSDDKGPSDADALILGAAGCPLALSAGELLLLCREGAASVGGASFAGCGFAFGIGGEDAVSLHAVDGALVDEAVGCCSGDAGSSYGRPEGGGGGFAVLPRRTPGAPNIA